MCLSPLTNRCIIRTRQKNSSVTDKKGADRFLLDVEACPRFLYMETLLIAYAALLTLVNVVENILHRREISRLSDRIMAKDLADYVANTQKPEKEEIPVADSGLRTIDDPEVMQALHDEIYGEN